MLKILIIEDEQAKKRLLAEAIGSVRVDLVDSITFADNVRDAKRELSRCRFDLVVLDLNIPRVASEQVAAGAGLEVLSFIRTNKRAIAPGYVIGLTAYDEAFVTAVDAFESAVWKLMRFSHSDVRWRRALSSAVEYLSERQSPPFVSDGRTHHCDVGVVVALEEELNGVLALPCDWKRVNVRHDSAMYYMGNLKIDGAHISLVATAARRMGMTNMAISAAKLVFAFHPRLLASTGLCAGVRGKTEIGDVLVADPCFDWGSGKWVREGKNRLKFQPAPYQWRLDARLASAVREIGNDRRFLEETFDGFAGMKASGPPRVYIEAMASGASVLQVKEMVSDIREQHKNLIGIEMENYAVFEVAENASEPRPIVVTIKSVCDFGDEDKSEGFRAYAIHTSAQVFWRLIHDEEILFFLGIRGVQGMA
jgi:nucleoside phosphorylase